MTAASCYASGAGQIEDARFTADLARSLNRVEQVSQQADTYQNRAMDQDEIAKLRTSAQCARITIVVPVTKSATRHLRMIVERSIPSGPPARVVRKPADGIRGGLIYCGEGSSSDPDRANRRADAVSSDRAQWLDARNQQRRPARSCVGPDDTNNFDLRSHASEGDNLPRFTSEGELADE